MGVWEEIRGACLPTPSSKAHNPEARGASASEALHLLLLWGGSGAPLSTGQEGRRIPESSLGDPASWGSWRVGVWAEPGAALGSAAAPSSRWTGSFTHAGPRECPRPTAELVRGARPAWAPRCPDLPASRASLVQGLPRPSPACCLLWAPRPRDLSDLASAGG